MPDYDTNMWKLSDVVENAIGSRLYQNYPVRSSGITAVYNGDRCGGLTLKSEKVTVEYTYHQVCPSTSVDLFRAEKEPIYTPCDANIRDFEVDTQCAPGLRNPYSLWSVTTNCI